MRTIIRTLLLPALAVAAMLATAVPAFAGSALSTTGGCTAMGQTSVTGSLGWSETDAAPYGGCGNTLSSARFTVGGTNHYFGPGWVSGSYAYSDTSSLGPVTVTSALGSHNLCNAGGPCPPPGSQPWGTTY